MVILLKGLLSPPSGLAAGPVLDYSVEISIRPRMPRALWVNVIKLVFIWRSCFYDVSDGPVGPVFKGITIA